MVMAQKAGGVMILGLDPGTTAENPVGVALIQSAPSDLLVLGTAVLRPRRAQSRATFAAELSVRLRTDWLNRVDLLAVEWPYVGMNAQSALDLAAICGVAIAAAGERQVKVRLVAPSEAKVALAGRGDADKAAMIAAARRRFGLALVKDAADAVGIGLAAVQGVRV